MHIALPFRLAVSGTLWTVDEGNRRIKPLCGDTFGALLLIAIVTETHQLE